MMLQDTVTDTCLNPRRDCSQCYYQYITIPRNSDKENTRLSGVD